MKIHHRQGRLDGLLLYDFNRLMQVPAWQNGRALTQPRLAASPSIRRHLLVAVRERLRRRPRQSLFFEGGLAWLRGCYSRFNSATTQLQLASIRNLAGRMVERLPFQRRQELVRRTTARLALLKISAALAAGGRKEREEGRISVPACRPYTPVVPHPPPPPKGLLALVEICFSKHGCPNPPSTERESCTKPAQARSNKPRLE